MSLNVGSLNADLILNIKAFMSNLNVAVEAVKKAGQEIGTAFGAQSGQGFSTMSRRFTTLKNRTTEISEAITKLKQEFADIGPSGQKSFSDINNAAKSAASAVGKVSQKLNNQGTTAPTTTTAPATATATTSTTTTQTSATAANNAAAASMHKASNAARQATTAARQAGQAAQKAGQQAQKAGAQASQAGQQGQAAGNKTQQGFNNAAAAVKKLQNQVSHAGKDILRVFSGIIISQTFYKLTNGIQDAASALVTFENNMRTSAISMKYLLDNSKDSGKFIEMMKDFAAVTPYTTEESIGMARSLMAMGFQAQSVRSVMETLTDTASAMGIGGDVLERITWSLGQIGSTGKLAGQEVRELGKAGIPILKILREELGLSSKELSNLGDLKIPGDVAVQAILRGLKKRYGGASKEIAQTMPGMWSTIKDDMLIISNKIMQGPYNIINGFVTKIRDAFETARTIVRKKGIGGLFEAVVPKSLQQPIRMFIGAIIQLGGAVKTLMHAFAPVIKLIGEDLGRVLEDLIPAISNVITYIIGLFDRVVNGIPALQQLFRVLGDLLIAWVVGRALLWLWGVLKIGNLLIGVVKTLRLIGDAIQFIFIAATKNPIVAVITLIAGALLTLALSSQQASAWLSNLWGKLTALGSVGNILQPESVAGEDSTWDDYLKDIEDMGTGFEDLGDQAKAAGAAVKKGFLAAFDEVFTIPEENGGGGGGGIKLPKRKKPPEDPIPPKKKEPIWYDDTIPPPDPGPWQRFGEALSRIWGKIKEIALKVWDAIKPFRDFLGEGANFLGAFYEGVATFVADILEGKSLSEAAENFRKIMWDAIKGTWLEDLGRAFIGWWEGTVKSFKDAWENIKLVGTSIGNFFKSWWDGTVKMFNDAWSNVKLIADAVWQGMIDIGEGIADFFEGAIDTVKEWWGSAVTYVDGLKDKAKNLVEKISSWIGDIGGKISKWYTDVKNNVVTWFNDLITKVKGFGKDITDGFANKITEGKTWISTKVKEVVDAVSGFFSNLVTKIKTFGTDTLTKFWDGMQTNVNDIKNKISNFATVTIPGWFNGIGDKFKNIGANIVNGIWNGVNGAIAWLKRKLEEFADKLPQWLKDALGIKSPATSTMPIGQMLLAGIYTGADKDMIKFRTNMQGLVTSMWDGLSLGPKLVPAGISPMSASSFVRRSSGSAVSDTMVEVQKLIAAMGSAKNPPPGTEPTAVIKDSIIIADKPALRKLEQLLRPIRDDEDKRRG